MGGGSVHVKSRDTDPVNVAAARLPEPVLFRNIEIVFETGVQRMAAMIIATDRCFVQISSWNHPSMDQLTRVAEGGIHTGGNVGPQGDHEIRGRHRRGAGFTPIHVGTPPVDVGYGQVIVASPVICNQGTDGKE